MIKVQSTENKEAIMSMTVTKKYHNNSNKENTHKNNANNENK